MARVVQTVGPKAQGPKCLLSAILFSQFEGWNFSKLS